jgi:hypothetical protein
VLVIEGTHTFEYEHGGECITKTISAGEGFQKPLGPVRSSSATGANFYGVYVLREDADDTAHDVEAPAACT